MRGTTWHLLLPGWGWFSVCAPDDTDGESPDTGSPAASGSAPAASGAPDAGAGLRTVAEALRACRAGAEFLTSPATAGALASVLRRTLLGAPLNTRSVPLDVGYSNSIPQAIRHAVILRDQHCAWPGGCDKRPAACDVHHIVHKRHGGPTSVKDCILLCQYHHDVCIHRNRWTLELLPDGSTRATSPDGQIIRSHAPPPAPPPTAPLPPG
jgi:hypothetical protein